MRLSKYFQKPKLLPKLAFLVFTLVVALTSSLFALFYIITLGSFKFEDAMSDVFNLLHPLLDYAEK